MTPILIVPFSSCWNSSPHHDSQLVSDKQCWRFIPGETLEECRKPLRLRLFFRSTREGSGTWQCASCHPHPSSLSHKHLPWEDLLCFCHPNRSASTLCNRISASSRRDISGINNPLTVWRRKYMLTYTMVKSLGSVRSYFKKLMLLFSKLGLRVIVDVLYRMCVQ